LDSRQKTWERWRLVGDLVDDECDEIVNAQSQLKIGAPSWPCPLVFRFPFGIPLSLSLHRSLKSFVAWRRQDSIFFELERIGNLRSWLGLASDRRRNVISRFNGFWRVHAKPLKRLEKRSPIAVTPG
jgi:hypothetical protein